MYLLDGPAMLALGDVRRTDTSSDVKGRRRARLQRRLGPAGRLVNRPVVSLAFFAAVTRELAAAAPLQRLRFRRALATSTTRPGGLNTRKSNDTDYGHELGERE